MVLIEATKLGHHWTADRRLDHFSGPADGGLDEAAHDFRTTLHTVCETGRPDPGHSLGPRTRKRKQTIARRQRGVAPPKPDARRSRPRKSGASTTSQTQAAPVPQN